MRVMREGSTLIEICSYAPGDGTLGFVAQDIRTSAAVSPGPTVIEAERACPVGWHVTNEHGIPRAHRDAPDPLTVLRAIVADIDRPGGSIHTIRPDTIIAARAVLDSLTGEMK